MRIFDRAVLEKTFPGNRRAVAAFERLDSLLSDTNDQGQTLLDRVEALAASDGGGFQKAHPMLDALTQLEPGKIGTIEIAEDGSARIREVDALDPASLLSRGVAYTVLAGWAGKGTTAQRPAVPSNAGAIYMDTTLDPDGQPIIWNGTEWVNFSGAPV